MRPSDAAAITQHMLNFFPDSALSEEQAAAFVSEIALLSNAEVGMAAALMIIRSAERFPSIAQFRTSYHAINNRLRDREALLAANQGARSPIEDWVHVWYWAMQQPDDPARFGFRIRFDLPGPTVARRIRSFPQTLVPPATPADIANALSADEYEHLENLWREAGSPHMRDTNELLGLIS